MKISASSSRFCFQLVAAAFSLVVFSCAAGAAETPQRSRIYVYDLRTHSSKLVFTADTIWEAPNWSPDGKYLISNSGGLIYKLVFKADGTVQTPEKLNVPHDYECNNDKGISPDGT
jgi:TolB protein